MDKLAIVSTESTVVHTVEHHVSVQSGQSVVSAPVAVGHLSVLCKTDSYLGMINLPGRLQVNQILDTAVLSFRVAGRCIGCNRGTGRSHIWRGTTVECRH